MNDYAKPLPRGEDMHGEFYQTVVHRALHPGFASDVP
jgi:hypothetical protein